MSPPDADRPMDPDISSALVAMRRAALRARETARATGTKLVVVIDGELLHLDPDDPRLTADEGIDGPAERERADGSANGAADRSSS